jgi:hypothetical protein
MEPKKPEPSELEKFAGRYPLYVRIGFAMVVLFGMVGNCAGRREGSLVVFIIVTILWACSRMVQEGIDAWRILSLAKKHDQKKDDDEGGFPPGPPAAP